MHVYDAAHGQLVEALSGHGSWVLSVSASPSGAAFATGSSDRTVKLWEWATRSCVQTAGEQAEAVWAVAFRPDGAGLAAAGDGRALVCYDVM